MVMVNRRPHPGNRFIAVVLALFAALAICMITGCGKKEDATSTSSSAAQDAGGAPSSQNTGSQRPILSDQNTGDGGQKASTAGAQTPGGG